MFTWFLDLFPDNYKWDIAIKKAAYMAAKWIVAGIVAVGIGPKMDVENLRSLEVGIGAATSGALEVLHDWAKLKWPTAKWL